MTLTVVWSAQARNQFVASLTYIAKEDPLTAELVHKRVDKSLKLLCNSPEMGVPAPTAGVRTYAVPKTGFNAGTGNGRSLSQLTGIPECAPRLPCKPTAKVAAGGR